MRIFKHLVFIIFLSIRCEAAEICKFDFKQWGAMHGKAQITFSDGREITIIGHNHGNSETNAQLIPAILEKKSSNAEYINKLLKLLNKSRLAIEQSKRELEYLHKRLSKDKNLFVAIEATDSGAKIRNGMANWMDQISSQEFTMRNLHNPVLRRDVLLMLSGADGYLNLTEPGLFKNRPAIGVDDSSLEDLPDIWRESDIRFSRLIDKVGKDSLVGLELIDTQNQISAKYTVLDKLSDKNLIEKILQKVPAQYHVLTTSWLSEELKGARILLRRDIHIVNRLISQEQSGILLIGYAHLQSLMIRIQNECESQRNHKWDSKATQSPVSAAR